MLRVSSSGRLVGREGREMGLSAGGLGVRNANDSNGSFKIIRNLLSSLPQPFASSTSLFLVILLLLFIILLLGHLDTDYIV